MNYPLRTLSPYRAAASRSASTGLSNVARRALPEAARIAARTPLPEFIMSETAGLALGAEFASALMPGLNAFLLGLAIGDLAWEAWQAYQSQAPTSVPGGQLVIPDGWQPCRTTECCSTTYSLTRQGLVYANSSHGCAASGCCGYLSLGVGSTTPRATDTQAYEWYKVDNIGWWVGKTWYSPGTVTEFPYITTASETPAEYAPLPDIEIPPVHPALDPFSLPIQQPVPDYPPLPLRSPRPAPNPWRAPNEQPQRGPQPKPKIAPRPLPPLMPSIPGVAGPTLILEPTGDFIVRPPTGKLPEPPPPRTRERKQRWMVSGAAHVFFGTLTEVRDLVQSIYQAIPKAERKLAAKEWGRKKGKPRLPEMLWAIYENFGDIDWYQANRNFLVNEIQDFTYGMAGRLNAMASARNPYYQRPVSPQFGQRYWPNAGSVSDKAWQWPDVFGDTPSGHYSINRGWWVE